ncbi:type II toxin-antitoxin system RatA family toxin [Gammaproteobacteria bacterium]|nr:type II toxin-antitoxin system RatA family toxin [Gammaproteobacteria bacterium]
MLHYFIRRSQKKEDMGYFHKHYIAHCTPQQAYDIVDQTERYAEILPYCDDAGIIKHESDSVKIAYLNMGYQGFTVRLVTRNECLPPNMINVSLVEGPMSSLKGQWQFKAHPNGCKVEVVFEYQFTNWLIQQLFERLLTKLVDDVIERFVQATH